MVVTRSGKNTNRREARTQRCGHVCCMWDYHSCCVCRDVRPTHPKYAQYYKPNTPSYCPSCASTVPAHVVEKPAPAPVVAKPAPAPAVFRPTVQFELAETRKQLAETQKQLTETQKQLAAERDAARAWETAYRKELEEWRECYNDAIRTIETLRNRINNPSLALLSRKF